MRVKRPRALAKAVRMAAPLPRLHGTIGEEELGTAPMGRAPVITKREARLVRQQQRAEALGPLAAAQEVRLVPVPARLEVIARVQGFFADQDRLRRAVREGRQG